MESGPPSWKRREPALYENDSCLFQEGGPTLKRYRYRLIPPEGKDVVMVVLFRYPLDIGVKFIAQPVEKIAQLLPIPGCPLAQVGFA